MPNINIMNGWDKKSDVVDFYVGKSVFVTGGTGFLGKILIEKLLYTCSDINKIYILVRDKKNVNAYERIAGITNSPIFERLKQQKSGCLKKIIPMVGDIAATNLGLCDNDLNIVEQEVSVVFHAAASVNFQETLKESLAINVNGTKEIIKICQRMKKLEACVHVSTAYCNADRDEIEEKIYPAPHSLDYVQHLAETCPNDEEVVNRLLGKRPNIYTYTKALAEEMVQKESHNLPIAIVRPSIVISTLREPLPGWIDNWNGPTGLLVAMTKGIMRSMYGDGNNVTDLIPVDFVNNLVIVAATQCDRTKKLKVYNCCTGNSNPITWNKMAVIVKHVTTKYSLNILPAPFIIFYKYYWFFVITKYIFQIIPAYIFDLCGLLIGKKPRHVKIQNKLSFVVSMLSYFCLKQWTFSDKNVKNLLSTMSEQDKKLFNFDVKTINWETYVTDYVLGSRKHLLKSPPKQIN